jgi:uncharacterized protein DUF1566
MRFGDNPQGFGWADTRGESMTIVGKISACVALGALVCGGSAWAATPADKCEAAKLGTAGKYAFCRLKADAKALKTGGSPDYSKCDAAFAAKWAATETKAAGACPSTGDQASEQAELTANAGRTAWRLSMDARFTDNGDGTITDRQTGLIWEKKIKRDSTTDFANLQDADNTYRWAGQCSSNASKLCQPTAAAAAACTANVAGNPSGCAQCTGGDGTCNASSTVWTWILALNAANFAGHADWRVPTRDDLASIIDYSSATYPAVDDAFQGASCGAACTDVTSAACSCTQAGNYWSQGTYALFTDYAWYVYFLNGYVFYDQKINAAYVRAVRGGS